jgi:hypothetical protein
MTICTVKLENFADKIFRDNNIDGAKMTFYSQYKDIFVSPILFPPIYLSANILNFTVFKQINPYQFILLKSPAREIRLGD